MRSRKNTRPCDGWKKEKNISFFTPLGRDLAYVPLNAMYEDYSMDNTSLLLSVVEEPYSASQMIEHIE